MSGVLESVMLFLQAATGQAAGDQTVHANVLLALRWIHFMAGITWIGHLYFFNLVQGPFEKVLDADAKKKVIPELRPRALWWFRWGAMITMLSGVMYLLHEQFAGGQKFAGWFENAGNIWITFGGVLGLIMWFNVWFIIWPQQRVIINGIKTGNKAPDHDARIRKAFLASRFNTYVSVPMLFGMASRTHFASKDLSTTWIMVPIMLVIGLGIAHFFINWSAKVKSDV